MTGEGRDFAIPAEIDMGQFFIRIRVVHSIGCNVGMLFLNIGANAAVENTLRDADSVIEELNAVVRGRRVETDHDG